MLGGSRASAPPSPPSTPSASITSSASPATGRSRAHEPTAINGRWRRGPGAQLLQGAAARAAATLPLIAEDLGRGHARGAARCAIDFGLPGIKILQFAFGTDPNAPDFLPHNYPRNAVVYTGTHDNDTTAGWFHDPGSGTRSAEQTEKERQTALALPRPRRGPIDVAGARSTGR